MRRRLPRPSDERGGQLQLYAGGRHGDAELRHPDSYGADLRAGASGIRGVVSYWVEIVGKQFFSQECRETSRGGNHFLDQGSYVEWTRTVVDIV